MRDANPSDAILLDTSYPEPAHAGRAAAVIARTRARHARPRQLVERMIARQLEE